ncbi:MAG: DMT family transporter [Betaproteobacteria bacterium]|nr:DMT family transporter [Betaproteobacteria bacterium]
MADTRTAPPDWLALAALFAGATAIATAPLFVKVSETGPVATAFWRVFLALPLLWAWAAATQGPRLAAQARDHRQMLFAAGFFFAGDLAVWHWSILLTSVANTTLLANLAPIFVTAVTWLVFRERPQRLFLAGLAAAISGTLMLIGANFGGSGRALLGDALGVVTAMFYAAYQLSISKLRAQVPTASVMAISSTVMAVLLLPIAWISGERILPQTDAGWMKLIGIALFAQVIGQSLIAWAMAHLTATFSSVGLLLQPVMATLFAWILLGEIVGPLQFAGGALVLAGILLAKQAQGTRNR